MNRARVAILSRRIAEAHGRVAELFAELALALEAEDEKPAKRGRVLPFPTSPIDEVAAAEAKRILERKGMRR